MHHFRIFVSYASEDRQLAGILVSALRDLKLEPVWDKDIRPGTPFTDAIKGLISHVHVFMPVITDNSQKRPWVNQETGYAMALNIPVLPVAVNTLPAEMISQLQAISVNADGTDLAEKLSEINFEQLVSPPPPKPQSTVEIADWPETRTELMARYANLIIELGSYGQLRQRGALSSFCIPNKDIDHQAWKDREGPYPRSRYFLSLLREERRALEKHVRERGCLLMIDPAMEFSKVGVTARRARLESLQEFLKSMPEDKVRVVITPHAREGNLTIVGDWFVAESLTPRAGEGFKQTIFNWHAPTVLRWIRRFDDEFEEVCNERENCSSLESVIGKIDEIVTDLRKREHDGVPPTQG